MRFSLVKYLNIWFLYTFLMFFVTLIFSYKYENHISYFALSINLLYTFLFYAVVKKVNKLKSYNTSTLVLITSLFSILFLVLYNTLYYHETNTFFELNVKDSLEYHNIALKITNEGFFNGISNYFKNEDLEDFGAVFFTSLSYQIYPSNLSFNFLNLIAGLTTNIFLFKFSSKFMPKKYAFFVAIFYGLSSFIIYTYSTGLKEIFFVLFIILFFYNFTNFLSKRRVVNLLFSIVCLSCIYFFRPAIIYMIIGSLLLSWVYINKTGVLRMFFVIPIVLGVFLYFFNDIGNLSNKYYGSEERVKEFLEIEGGIEVNNLNYALSAMSGVIGPLPTYHALKYRMQQSLYSPSLGFRVLLSLMFLLGVKSILKSNNLILNALSFFIFFEVLSLTLILESFELRFNQPHYAFIYLISFMFIAKNEKIKIKKHRLYLALMLILIFGWNLRI